MLKKIVLSAILVMIVAMAWSQPPGTVSKQIKAQQVAEADPIEEDYQKRIQKSMLYGVYIPKDLGDVFNQLNQLTDSESRAKFTSMTEVDARQKLHFSLGRWIIHNWGFYEGSRLSKYLNDIGLYEPDDMARFIIVTYHRQLNGQALEVKKLIADFQEMRQLELEERRQKSTVIIQEMPSQPVKQNK